MSVLLFCRKMGLLKQCLKGSKGLWVTFLLSVLFTNICGAFTVYKTTSPDNTRVSATDYQRRLRDIQTSEYRMKDFITDYLENGSNRDEGETVDLDDLAPDLKIRDVFNEDEDDSRLLHLQRSSSPLYSRLFKVVLEEDVQSPDVTIWRQKRPSYPGIMGFDNLDFAMTTLKGHGRGGGGSSSPPAATDEGPEEEVFAPSNRQKLHRGPPPMGQNNRRGWLSVGNGRTNLGELSQKMRAAG